MPRYFITTFDRIAVEDNEGIALPDRHALRALVRESLIAILQDESLETGVDQVAAEARDENGNVVMRAKASFVEADQ